MSKKKEKGCALERMVESRLKKLSKNHFFLAAPPIQSYCERIKGAAYGDCNDSAYINFNAGEQHMPSGVHHFTKSVAMVSPKFTDHYWVQSGEENITDAEAFIGKIEDPIIGIPEDNPGRVTHLSHTR